jgi:hypothetical protein
MYLACSAISGMLADIKRQAVTMGDELEEQNQSIGRTKEKIQVDIIGAYMLTDRTAKH